MNGEPVIVIGAGIAGLAAAARLAAAGRQVLVLESSPQPGGKLGLLEDSGFSWDTGPSLFTQPEQFDTLIRDCGREPRAYFSYRSLDIGTRYFWDDGQQFQAAPDRAGLLQAAEAAFGESARALEGYLSDAERLYRKIGPLFLDKPLHRLRDWSLTATLNALPAVRPAYLLKSLHSYNAARLKNPRLVQVLDRMATYNGSDPYRCPAMLSMIAQLEFNEGAWYPDGGMISLPRALRRLCEDLGVEFEFGKPVRRLIRNPKSWSVSGDGFRHHAPAVVSNLDVVRTYRDLLGDAAIGERLLKQERSCSGLVFYWGMNRAFPQLDLHNIFFSSDYREEFRSLFKKQRISDDPTVYINITSKQDPTHAPCNAENWFVLVNAPTSSTNMMEPEEIQRVRDAVLRKLENAMGQPVGDAIGVAHHLTPAGIERATGSIGGALYGSSSNGRMAAFHRHPNYSDKYPGLYFAGGTVHPGGGIPLCLRSGKIAAAELLRDSGKHL
jgi:diapolycopene oxygenase